MTSPEKQLKKLRKESAPRKEFKKELWSELDLTWKKEYPAMRFSWIRAFAVPLAALALFVTMGTGVYAYSSPEVTEDTPLYPVKRGIESVEERFHRSSKAQAHFHARMVERRINEGEVMLRRGHISRAQLLEIANELDYTIEDFITAKEDPASRQEIEQNILNHMDTQSNRYRFLLERSFESREIMEDTQPNQTLRNKLRDIRVRINESDLTEEEKHALFDEIEPELIRNIFE